ncbi:hypothetical protein SO802_002213 [Lithocarpus litseifolius]|uniref:Nodulin-like domain-containing protein n=1 Tax=Lithocarpus litseifolius TaxID=425828 RepID=A0AAW2E0D0_9ROSI
MAKRKLSSTLRNLKFMQRAALREENTKKDEDVKPDGNFCSPSTFNRKCVVIMEGDPHSGAIKGRMSFQSFNPSIDKLNEAASNPVSATSTGGQSGGISLSKFLVYSSEVTSILGYNQQLLTLLEVANDSKWRECGIACNKLPPWFLLLDITLLLVFLILGYLVCSGFLLARCQTVQNLPYWLVW